MARGPETYWVRNASVAAQRGRAAQKGRMPVRQQKAGTMAGVPYDWLRQHWAETAVMPVRQLGWYDGRSSVQWAETAVS